MDQLQDRPTLDDMRYWRDALDGEWNMSYGMDIKSLADQQERAERAYFEQWEGQFTAWGEDPVKTGSAPSDVDAAADSIAPPIEMLVRVKPLKDRKKHKELAEKIRLFGTAVIDVWRKRKDIFGILATDQTLLSYAVWRVMLDDRLWPSFPDKLATPPIKKDGEVDAERYAEMYEDWEFERDIWAKRHRKKFPIVIDKRDPRHVRWREINDEIVCVVESYETTVLEAEAAFGVWPRAREILKDRRGSEPIRVDDVWYGKYRCVLIQNEPIGHDQNDVDGGGDGGEGVIEHGYPEIPYVIAPFRELGFSEVAKKYRNLLSNSINLYPIESDALTAHMVMLRWNSWRSWMGHTNDGRELVIKPGVFIDINQAAGEHLAMLEGRPVPPELLATSEMIDGMIQRNSTSQGPRSVEGTRSAQQLWAIQSSRKKKLETPKQNMERGISRSLMLTAMILETMLPDEEINLPVPGYNDEGEDLGSITIKGKDFNGYWDGFRVRFSDEMDPAKIELWKSLMTFAINNWLPIKKTWELGGVTDNPEQLGDDLLDQSIERLPQMLEAIGAKRVKAYFGEDSGEYALYMQLLMEAKQQGAQPGAPGVPSPGGGGTPASPSGPVAAPGGQSAGGGGPSSAPAGNTRTFGNTGAGSRQGGSP